MDHAAGRYWIRQADAIAKRVAVDENRHVLAQPCLIVEHVRGNYPPPFLGRRYLGRQAKVSRMVWKGFAPLSLAVSTVVLTSASAFAAHMAR